MIRIVPTGDLGLDVLTGGGWRLVKRFEERASACVVVRGGPGAGKSTLGIHVALELATALGGDVAVGCVEILPTEYVAQLQSTRPSLEATRVVQLPAIPTPLAERTGPRVFIGLMTELDPAQPDLSANLAALGVAVKSAGGKPAVFIVDSLIEGYGIGSSINRIDADATIKFAVQGGYALVLCEETVSDTPSPWVFAADTVLQLGVESRERGRWIEVKKHRFGPSATGRHILDLVGQSGPSTFPAPHAWRTLGDIVLTRAAQGTQRQEAPLLTFALAHASSHPVFRGRVLVVTAPSERRARFVAMAVRRATDELIADPRPMTWFLEIDPTSRMRSSFNPRASDKQSSTVHFFPLHDGAERFLAAALSTLQRFPNEPATFIIGDLRHVLFARDAEQWTAAVETIVITAVELRPLVTVVFCVGEIQRDADEWLRLQRNADVAVFVQETHQEVRASISAREQVPVSEAIWQQHVTMPGEDSFDQARARVVRG